MLYLFALLSILLPGRAQHDSTIGPSGIPIIADGSSPQGGRTCTARPYDRAERHSNHGRRFIAARGTPELSAPSSWLQTPDAITRAEIFCYSVPSMEPICTTWTHRIPGELVCSDGFAGVTHKKSAKPASMLNDTDSTCYYKYAKAFEYDQTGNADEDAGGHDFTIAYNSAKLYLETCYDSIPLHYDAFGIMGDALGGMGRFPFEDTDNARWANWREWLKSVLWLNRVNPVWYCICAESIAGSYEWDSTANGVDYNAVIAVDRFLLQSGRCTFYDSSLKGALINDSLQRHQIWWDTFSRHHEYVDTNFPGDSVDFPVDTTIPTIQQLGLQVLLGPPAEVSTSTFSQKGMGVLTASENPFNKETTVSFLMGEYAYVSFQLSDVLGRVVQGDFKGTVLPPGAHSFDIDGTNLPSGTYFARVTTPLGETRTLKLVKE